MSLPRAIFFPLVQLCSARVFPDLAPPSSPRSLAAPSLHRAQAASKEDLKDLAGSEKKGAGAKKQTPAQAKAAAARAAKAAAKAAAKSPKKPSGGSVGADDDGAEASTPGGSVDGASPSGGRTPGGSGSQRPFKGATQQWTLDEDNQLRRLVDEHGHRKWSFIANKMEGRRGKQCRDRWLNHLKPDIRRGEWTAEEERILVEGHRMLGTASRAAPPSCSR